VVNGLYPFQGRFFDRNGIKLHYLDEGRGHPVVMLHGNPTWSFYYRNLVLALRDGTPGFRCVVPDHIGCGLSEKPSADRYDYSLRSRIADLEALLEHLGVQECSLVVHDWGGMIGMAWAVRHADRIRKLVVMNTAAFPLPSGKKLPFALRLGRNTWLGTWLIRRMNLFCRMAARMGVKRTPLPRPVRAEYLRPYDSWQNRIAISRFVQTIPLCPTDPGYDIVEEVGRGLEQLRSKPMLIAWGMRDFVFDASFFDEWWRRFPEAEVMRIDDAGHYVLEDAASEIIAKALEFL
jgi:pimeloyl-ACP methyl ester carboxylesterase